MENNHLEPLTFTYALVALSHESHRDIYTQRHYDCTHTRASAHTYTHFNTQPPHDMHTRTHTCTRAHILTPMRTHTLSALLCTHISSYIHMHIHIHRVTLC